MLRNRKDAGSGSGSQAKDSNKINGLFCINNFCGHKRILRAYAGVSQTTFPEVPDTWEGMPEHQVPRYRERPNCRKIILGYISNGIHLAEVASSYGYSGGLRKQARKMLNERR